MSRITLAFMIFLLPALAMAQDQTSAARAAAGCGPAETQFNVKTDKKQHPMMQPEAGKALVYVFEDEKHENETFRIGAVTIRVGLDGKWMGANHGDSYFSFAADPGEHRLCTDWQSSLKRLSKLGSAVTINVEAGKIYYYRAQVDERKEHPPAVVLEPIDNAQGQFLISSHALSSFRMKEVASADTN